jgi:uncharacterized protein (TIGR00369 family)
MFLSRHDRRRTLVGFDMTPNIAHAQDALAQQPFSALVGARLIDFGAGGATLELDVRDDHRQQHGLVHGGVLAYLVDNAVTFAAGSTLGRDLVTSGFTIDYLRPATGPALRATATVTRSGRTQAVVRCDVEEVQPGGAAALVAIGQGRVSRRPPRAAASDGGRS